MVKKKINPVKCKNADQYLGLYKPTCNNGNPCEVCSLRFELQQKRREFQALKDAAQRIYYSACWYPDRPLAYATNMWARLRDAAGFPKGCSPTPVGDSVPLGFEEFKRRMMSAAAGVVQVMSGKAVKRINIEYHE